MEVSALFLGRVNCFSHAQICHLHILVGWLVGWSLVGIFLIMTCESRLEVQFPLRVIIRDEISSFYTRVRLIREML